MFSKVFDQIWSIAYHNQYTSRVVTCTCTYLPELHVPVFESRFAGACYGENLKVRKPLGVISVNMGVDIDTRMFQPAM